jgi:hypothetical protein
MRPKIFLSALLILVAVLVLLWFVRPKPRQMSSSPEGAQVVTDRSKPATASETRTGAKPVSSNAPASSELVEQRDLKGVRTDIENAAMTQLWKMPITFYGVVIDQNTNPVPDAQIHFAWTDLSPTRRSETNTQSDANGLFGLSGVTGRGLEVRVSKAGYYASRRGTTAFDYGDNYQPDGNPVLFLLHKHGTGADLITSRYGVTPDFPVSAPRDGTPVLVDLLHRKFGAEGQLEIKQVKPEYLDAKKATAWRFRMEIKDGGLLEHNDEFPFEAPQNGYQPVVDFDFKLGATNWTTMLSRHYYIAFGQPRRYGWLKVETRIGSGGATLEYAINPDGSRYLEPKPPTPPQPRQLPPGVREVIPGNPP